MQLRQVEHLTLQDDSIGAVGDSGRLIVGTIDAARDPLSPYEQRCPFYRTGCPFWWTLLGSTLGCVAVQVRCALVFCGSTWVSCTGASLVGVDRLPEALGVVEVRLPWFGCQADLAAFGVDGLLGLIPALGAVAFGLVDFIHSVVGVGWR